MTLQANIDWNRRILTSAAMCGGLRGYGGAIGCLFLLICLLWVAPVRAVDFPGPIALAQNGASLSAQRVHFPGADRDFFVTGSGGGFLNLYQFIPQSGTYPVLHRFFVGGEVVDIIPWLGRPLQQMGLVVAVNNPDRILFVEVNTEFPNLVIAAEVPLEEDIGELAFVGHAITGPGELAASLPGVDQVVFLAEEDGLWAVRAVAATGDHPASLVGVDLDGDTVLELVVANAGPLSGTLGIYRRQADASYVGEIVSVPAGLVARVAAHDVDQDGRQELAVSMSDAPLVVFYFDGGGGLVEVSRVALSVGAQSMHLIDLADGSPGLFTGNRDRGWLEFSVYRGGSWEYLEAYYPGCRPHEFTFADLDGDGLDDLVTLGGDADLLTGMLANGKPGFWGFPALSLDLDPGTFASADLDADGWPDLLLTDSNQMTLSLFRGTSVGGLSLTSQTWDMGFIPGQILALNLDTDAQLEVAVLDVLNTRLVLFDFSVTTGFTELVNLPVGAFPFYLAAADLDADSKMDLMVLSQADPEVQVLYGNGDGTVAESVTFGFTIAADWIVPVDLNGDGLLDVAATDGVSRVWTMANLGGRQFGEQSFANAGAGVLFMATGDLDADGDDDLVVANRSEHSLSFFENDGLGGLVRRIGAYSLPGAPAGLELADFNQDNRTDVMVNLAGNGTVGLVQGFEDWVYNGVKEFAGGPEMSGIKVIDLNLDGVPDILALDRSLRLGLSLINVNAGQVAVAPTALTAECRGSGLQLRIRPDRPGSWALELGRDGQWRSAMANGQALVGAADYDGTSWYLNLAAEQVETWAPGQGILQARLTVGEGADLEREIWPLDLGCVQSRAGLLPQLVWQTEPWPNPFNPQVQARFTLGQAASVTVAVYDLAGRRVATLAEGDYAAGEHLVRWDGKGPEGSASAGVYFIRVQAPNGVISRKLVLVK